MNLRALAVVAVCASLTAAQVPNDICNYAIYVTLPALVSGNNIGANLQFPGCASIGADVFYRFTAPYDGTVTLSTCSALGPGSANFDTVIIVRLGACQTQIVGCNDDYCGSESWLQIPILVGNDYDVQLGGWQGAQGNFTLSIVGTPAPPVNDTCATATPIGANSVVTGLTIGASTGPDPAGCAGQSKDVWYAFTAPACGTYDATTCVPGTSFDTVVAVWQGSCGALSLVGCSDDSCISFFTASTVSFYADAGSTRYISVGGFAGGSGSYAFTVSSVASPAMNLSFSNNGPGTLGFTIINGPPGGYAFTAFTANAGAYPNGWFSGIDIAVPDVIAQWAGGYPFIAPLSSPCGSATIGPFANLPNGFTVYAVAHGFAAGSFIPATHSAPASTTIP